MEFDVRIASQAGVKELEHIAHDGISASIGRLPLPPLGLYPVSQYRSSPMSIRLCRSACVDLGLLFAAVLITKFLKHATRR